ncbi:MAG TPA: uridine kinase [Bacteroidota bacterium]|nr:uridine kinase [Bacteroidota bacterium]
MTSLVIGIAGGTGSGKTSVTNKILESLEKDRVVVIQHDSYYKDLDAFGGLTLDKINFDHPSSLETDLLVRHIRDLKSGRPVDQPLYNFTTLRRLRETVRLEPKDIIIVEGILIFVEKDLRDLMDIKIFIDTDADERLIRRIKRDTLQRGRSLESIINQYVATVKPMHLEFVEPSKHWADMIIPRGADNGVAIDMVVSKIKMMLQAKSHARVQTS